MPNLRRHVNGGYAVTGVTGGRRYSRVIPDPENYILRSEAEMNARNTSKSSEDQQTKSFKGVENEALRESYNRAKQDVGGSMNDGLGRADVGHAFFYSYNDEIDKLVVNHHKEYSVAAVKAVNDMHLAFDRFAECADKAISEAESKLAATQLAFETEKAKNEQLESENAKLIDDIKNKDEKTKKMQAALDKAAPELRKAAAMDKILEAYSQNPDAAMKMLGEYAHREEVRAAENERGDFDVSSIHQEPDQVTVAQREDKTRNETHVVIAGEADVFTRAAAKFEDDAYNAITDGDLKTVVREHVDKLNDLAAASGSSDLIHDVDAENKAYMLEYNRATKRVANNVINQFEGVISTAGSQLAEIAQQREDIAVELNESKAQSEALSKENNVLKERLEVVEYMNESTLGEVHDMLDYDRKGYTDEDVLKRSKIFTDIMDVYRTDPQAAISMLHNQVYNNDLQQQNNEPVYDSSASYEDSSVSYEDSSVSYEADVAEPAAVSTSEPVAEQKPDYDTSNLEQGTTTVSSKRIAELNAELGTSTIYSNDRYDSNPNPNPDDEFGS